MKFVYLPKKLFCVKCGEKLKNNSSKYCLDCRLEIDKIRNKEYRMKRG